MTDDRGGARSPGVGRPPSEDGTGPPPGGAAPPEDATPSLSAAEALAGTPFFAELSAVDLARMVPELEEYHFDTGEVVFAQGDPGDGLYLIRSGTAEVTVVEEGGVQIVTALEAPNRFGESALLTDEPRAASVVAATPLAVWKLPRERFDALVDGHPSLLRQLAAGLAKRLSDTTRKVSASQEQVTAVARATYGTLDPGAQALLRRIAVFAEFDVDLLRATFEPEWSEEAFQRLVDEAVFFRSAERSGWYAFTQDSVRGFLLHQLRAELGERALNALRCHAATRLLDRDESRTDEVLDLVRAACDWPWLARLLEERSGDLAEHATVRLEGHLRALPNRLLWRRPALVRLLAECCAAQGKVEQAIEAYREAERRDRSARDGSTALEYQRALADLYARIGHEEDALACRRRLAELERRHRPADGARPGPLTEPPSGPERDAGWGVGLIDACRRSLRDVLDELRGWNPSTRGLLAVSVVVILGLAWLLPPPAGLSPAGLRVLTMVVALVVLGFLEVLPDHVLGLLAIAAWVATGTLPAGVATVGFASPTFFLLLAAMAIGAAVARSGLLYRGAIELVRHLPASHGLRCLTLGGLGMLFAPAMPSIAGRMMLALPLAQDIADTLRHPDRSGGSAGLALATYVGFGLMGPLFLTGSPNALIAYGLFPPETQERINWVSWFLAALPTHLVLFGLTMAFLLYRYRPERGDDVPEGTIALQRRVLGRITRHEWSAMAILGALLVGFSTQAVHGIDPAWIAVAAAGALFVVGALDDEAFKHGASVSLLVYAGVLLGLGEIFTHVELDSWLSQYLGSLAALIGGSALAFLMAIAAVTVFLSILLRPSPLTLLLAVALFPTAQSIGVDPWVVAFTVILANNLWLYPQQNLLYLMAYEGTGERAFSHEQARPLAFAYTAFIFVAILVSIPYWRWIGLIG